jgi:sugar/nucleoside kinase (ribokinase family)
MSTASVDRSAARPTRTLCLGDAVVDFVGQRRGASVTEVGNFSHHLGGTAASVAVVAARAGARIALAGGAGDDVWGRWLLARLRQEEIDSSAFVLVEGIDTPIAFVTVDPNGEGAYHPRGEAAEPFARALEGRAVEVAVEASAGLFLTSSTLAGADEREVTMRARGLALELERPIVFLANLDASRWRSRSDAAASANACVHDALLVCVNRADAAVMTGEDDPERAAAALVKGGAKLVVVALGRAGALLRGDLRADAPGVDAAVLNNAGALDVLTGTLLARLTLSGFYPPTVAASLSEAVRAAARASECWGAVD